MTTYDFVCCYSLETDKRILTAIAEFIESKERPLLARLLERRGSPTTQMDLLECEKDS